MSAIIYMHSVRKYYLENITVKLKNERDKSLAKNETKIIL